MDGHNTVTYTHMVFLKTSTTVASILSVDGGSGRNPLVHHRYSIWLHMCGKTTGEGDGKQTTFEETRSAEGVPTVARIYSRSAGIVQPLTRSTRSGSILILATTTHLTFPGPPLGIHRVRDITSFSLYRTRTRCSHTTSYFVIEIWQGEHQEYQELILIWVL
jgi:hypothetical protein